MASAYIRGMLNDILRIAGDVVLVRRRPADESQWHEWHVWGTVSLVDGGTYSGGRDFKLFRLYRRVTDAGEEFKARPATITEQAEDW